MNKQILMWIVVLMSLVLVSASVTFAVIHVTTSVSVNEPISPLSADVVYTFNPGDERSQTEIVYINNAASSNKTINVTYIETKGPVPQCGAGPFVYNMPFIQELTPGINIIQTTISTVSFVNECTIEATINVARI